MVGTLTPKTCLCVCRLQYEICVNFVLQVTNMQGLGMRLGGRYKNDTASVDVYTYDLSLPAVSLQEGEKGISDIQYSIIVGSDGLLCILCQS